MNRTQFGCMNRSRAGFAMLELLIGIAMLAMLATIVSGSLTFGRRVWERSEAISESGKRLAGLGYLRREISQAMVIPATDLDGDRQVTHFSGLPDRLSFASYLPVGDGDLAQPYVLAVEKAAEAEAMTVSFSPLLQRGVAFEKPDVRLLSGLSGIEIRYFGRMLDGDGTRWSVRWQDQPWLPSVVEISLRFEATAEEAETHRLVIRPRLH